MSELYLPISFKFLEMYAQVKRISFLSNGIIGLHLSVTMLYRQQTVTYESFESLISNYKCYFEQSRTVSAGREENLIEF